MQEVGGELATHVAQFFGAGMARRFAQAHAGLPAALGALFEIAGGAGRKQVLPTG